MQMRKGGRVVYSYTPQSVSKVRIASKPGCCCWPIGEVGSPEFHFCEVPFEGGPRDNYCLFHADQAFVRRAS